jgi:hypothetical protein
MTDISWGWRALSHAQAIAGTPFGRGSATKAESNAAEYVQAKLSDAGVKDVHSQPFFGLRSIWLFIALADGFALIGHAAFWLLRPSFGNWLALAISILAFAASGYLLWRKFTYRNYPLQAFLPHGPSQNVIATLPPKGEIRRRVVFIAHLDSHRAVWCFASDLLVVIYTMITPLGTYGFILAPLFYLLSALTHQPAFAWPGLIVAIAHFLGWFTGVTADLGPYSPGANDNASSVGLLLSLSERLTQESLEHTEVWLVFTGCEESGCDGMRTFLEECGRELTQALFVDFELIGIGDRLVYLRNEGMIRKRGISPLVERLVLKVGGDLGVHPAGAAGLGAFSEIGVAWEYGFQGVCFATLQKNRRFLPEWHRLTDTVDRLQPEALARAHDLAWRLLKED